MKNLKLKIQNSKLINTFGEKGMTLIELLLYMGLLSIFLVILTDIFVSILEVGNESDSTSNVEQDGRFVLARLSFDIRRATTVTVPAQDQLQLVISGTPYTYSFSGGNLKIDASDNLNSSETTVTANSLNPIFQKISNPSGVEDTVKIELKVESRIQQPGGPISQVFKTTVGKRRI